MKALTLHQPWASLVADRVKTVETRSWRTAYRGPLAIHAGQHAARLIDADRPWQEYDIDTYNATRGKRRALAEGCVPLPLGAVIATCELVDCVPTETLRWTGLWQRWAYQDSAGSPVYRPAPGHALPAVVPVAQRPYGDFTPGRFAWLLADIQPLDKPVPARGRQQLWDWKP